MGTKAGMTMAAGPSLLPPVQPPPAGSPVPPTGSPAFANRRMSAPDAHKALTPLSPLRPLPHFLEEGGVEAGRDAAAAEGEGEGEGEMAAVVPAQLPNAVVAADRGGDALTARTLPPPLPPLAVGPGGEALLRGAASAAEDGMRKVPQREAELPQVDGHPDTVLSSGSWVESLTPREVAAEENHALRDGAVRLSEGRAAIPPHPAASIRIRNTDG